MMDFRTLMNKLDMLNEGLTLSAVVAATTGYEQDDKVRLPLLAKLAKDNNLEGLVDPVTGNFVDVDGDEDDEVPFEVAEKLSAAGLLPPNAKLPQAGWFDNNRVFDAANANLKTQSAAISTQHNELADKLHQINELLKQLTDLHNKRAAATMASAGAAPVTSQTPGQAQITPNFASQGNMQAPGFNMQQVPDMLKGMKVPGFNGVPVPANGSGNYSTQYSGNTPPPNIANYLNQASSSLKDITAGMGNKGAQLNAMMANLPRPTTPAVHESFNGVADALLEAFGYADGSSPMPSASVNDAKYNAMDTSKFKPAAAKSAIKSSPLDMAKLAGSATKSAAPTVGKAALAKAGSKLIPGLGAAYGAYDAYDRAKEGDYLGSGIAAASGLVSLVPGIGTAASLGLDAINIGRTLDMEKAKDQARAQQLPATAAKPSDVGKKDIAIKPPQAAPPTAAMPSPPPLDKPAASVPAAHTATTSATKLGVKQFQEYLNSLGAHLEPDGKMGPLTRAAIKTYIRENRI
jgi:hypothetical protein